MNTLAKALFVAGLAAANPVPRSLDTNKFLDAIVKLMPVNKTINDICGAITKGEQLVSKAFDIDTSSSDSSCSDVKLIFTRGTCDPGNLGALVGPPFISALEDALSGKSFTSTGVEYPASVEGYLSADKTAGATMAQMVRDTASACPDTKIILGGYSQGGFSVHNAADDLGSDMDKVSAAVIFGDPLSHQAVNNIDASKVKIICHDDDDICNTGALILPEHLTYAIDAADAASFVASQL